LNIIAIERFHPIISFNILPKVLSKLFFIAFERKIAPKKNAGSDMDESDYICGGRKGL
jgi:hypothetical protein